MKRFILIACMLISGSVIQAQIPGSLDLSFGSWGKILVDYNNTLNSAQSIKKLPDGGFVVCGNNGFIGDEETCLLVKFLSNGSLDLTFGNQGMVEFGFGAETSNCFDIAILDDGRILVAGLSFEASNGSIGLARFTADGQPDATFGYSGSLIVDLGNNEYATSILLLSNNKFLICGATYGFSGNNDLLLAKFYSNGSIDESFGTNGYTITDLHNGSLDLAKGMVLHNNKILVSAYAFDQPYDAVVLARYTTTGALDPTFGVGGLSVFDGLSIMDMLVEAGTQLAIDHQNRIVVSGVSNGILGDDGMLLRFLPNGYPDNSFGDYGLKIYDIAGDNYFRSLAIQIDGKILAAGMSNNGSNDNTFLLRALEDGSPDPSFGLGDGYNVVGLSIGGSQRDMALAMTIQNDNKVLLTGFADTPDDHYDIVVSRYYLGVVTNTEAINPTGTITAFPDPTGSYLVINSLESVIPAYSFSLSDIRGKIIQQWINTSNQGGNFHLKLNSALPEGIYILGINDGIRAQSIKINTAM